MFEAGGRFFLYTHPGFLTYEFMLSYMHIRDTHIYVSRIVNIMVERARTVGGVMHHVRDEV